MSGVQRIAIIGAGAAGLCAARHVSQSKMLKPEVFEATDRIGGTWFYTDEIDKDVNGYPIQSSMYKDLRTNLPKQVMEFPDFLFKSKLPSFLHHDDVLNYLKEYATAFDLHQYIKLNTLVDEVSIAPGYEEKKFPKWVVKTYDWKTKKYDNSVYDGVFVCNGHYSVPNMPVIEGMDNFKGRLLHSHQYRLAEHFKDQRVVLFGGKSSGTDIALTLSKVAKSVILSHKCQRIVAPLPNNMHQESTIARFTEDGVVFDDGNESQCDSVMFCTGYNYHFPFFKTDDVIQVERNRITPLYKHMLHIHYPNLSFIGLCVHICPFPQFHCQVRVAVGVLDGSITLPSTQQMLKDQDEDFKKREANGLPVRGAHVLGDNQWAYNDELADMSRKNRISDHVRLLYDLTHHRRTFNLQTYKSDEFVKSEKGVYCKSHDSESDNHL